MEFTAHNILLPGGRQTKPGTPLLSESGICRAALRDLRLVLPNGGTVADLGCLEGGYAAEFARAGYRVTGIEAHPDNIACCREVEAELQLGLRFRQMDVRDMDEEFDAVFCCGLLYHLDRPAAFLNLLGKLTRKLLILQTHYSVAPGAENEGYSGHWYEEGATRWSSCGNPRSFWLDKPSLLAAVSAAGFDLVFEQADYRDDIRTGTYGAEGNDRGMFVGIKTVLDS